MRRDDGDYVRLFPHVAETLGFMDATVRSDGFAYIPRDEYTNRMNGYDLD